MRPAAREFGSILVAFGLSVGVVVATRTGESADARRSAVARRDTIVDATGRPVRARRFSRIASASLLVDRILLELVEPERIIGLSRYGFEGSSVAHLYGDRLRIDPSGDLEALVRARPELLLVNHFVEPGRVARLREAGIEVFDLGQMGGLDSLAEDIRVVGALIREPERGERLARSVLERMSTVAIDVPPDRRPTAIYVGVHGTQIYGGATGTSYHDVLTAAGLIDVAAPRYSGWPAYDGEAILSMNPDYVLSPSGQGRAICRQAGLESLTACTRPNHVIEVDSKVLVDPGITMLDAAEAVRDAIYGPPARLGGERR